MINRRWILSLLSSIPIAALPVGAAWAQSSSAKPSILRVGMTTADIPLTTGQASNGHEGLRFIGITIYDTLVRWDLSKRDEASKLLPGLAESWKVGVGAMRPSATLAPIAAARTYQASLLPLGNPIARAASSSG